MMVDGNPIAAGDVLWAKKGQEWSQFHVSDWNRGTGEVFGYFIDGNGFGGGYYVTMPTPAHRIKPEEPPMAKPPYPEVMNPRPAPPPKRTWEYVQLALFGLAVYTLGVGALMMYATAEARRAEYSKGLEQGRAQGMMEIVGDASTDYVMCLKEPPGCDVEKNRWQWVDQDRKRLLGEK